MKKLITISLLTLMLFGCGNSADKSSSEVETTTEVEVIADESIADEDTSSTYETFDEFQNSSFYAKLIEDGITPYHPVYDEERFSLSQIMADASFYMYCFYDSETEQGVKYCVTYDWTIADMSSLQSTFYNDSNILTTAISSNGAESEVLLNADAFSDTENYSIMYLPYPNYRVSIHTNNDSTADEMLALFSEFSIAEDEI